LIVRR